MVPREQEAEAVVTDRPSMDVVAATPGYPYTLHLRFADGTEGSLDLSGKVKGWDNLAAPLRDPGYFALVQVDEKAGTVVWPNGYDMAPETLHKAVAKQRRRMRWLRPKKRPVPHLTDLQVIGDYTLRLTFDDGLVGDVDLSGLPGSGPAFDGLDDRDYFAQAYVHPKARTVSWPGGPTLAPHGLYEDAGRNRCTTTE